MKYIGYHRASTKEQHLDRGILEINNFCTNNNIILHKLFTDKMSGRSFERPRYIVMKEDVLCDGDTLIITEIDRLGRYKKDILSELQYYKDHNIRVMILEIPTTLINLNSLADDIQKMMIEMINNILIEILAAMSQAEYKKNKKRQTEGIEAKKIRNDWDDYGRPRVMTKDNFKSEYTRVVNGEIKPFELMRELNMNVSTFYKYRNEYLKDNNK